MPDGLAGDNIPASARLVRIVEDYVNMTSGGNEDKPVLSPTVLSYLEREGGQAYDPSMAETFAKIIRALGVTPEQETMSVIAHELRTPLAFLVGFSELLAARGDLPDQAKEMADELHKQTEQMVVLTERLLELSRLQSGRVSLTYQWVDLKELVDEQITRAQVLSAEHTVRFDAPPQIVRARVDRTRLGQVVTNLLTNAIKYSPEGGEVTVSMEETANSVTVHIADQGLGIPADKVDRLFEPFYRVQSRETRQIEGLGLGLALTRAVVEAYGGEIWVESEPGEGSVFSYSLPKEGVRTDGGVPASSARDQL